MFISAVKMMMMMINQRDFNDLQSLFYDVYNDNDHKSWNNHQEYVFVVYYIFIKSYVSYAII